MKAALIEIQKADLGRRFSVASEHYARVDRQPLDPPPVVMLQLFEASNEGAGRERLKEVPSYEDVNTWGLIGTVDLFQVGGLQPESTTGRLEDTPESFEPMSPVPLHQDETYVLTSRTSHNDLTHDANVAQYRNNESEGATNNVLRRMNFLSGATFNQPHLVEHQGRRVLVFVFADLAVRTEGLFVLRYRVFDLNGPPTGHGQEDRVIQAECFGGPFRVYSPRDFPGFHASTALTKRLYRWGVRLNVREERQAHRKKGNTERSLYSTEALNVKRKRSSPQSPSDSDSDE